MQALIRTFELGSARRSLNPSRKRLPVTLRGLIGLWFFFLLTTTLSAAQYVAIKEGRLYNGNKEAGALVVGKVYECGGRSVKSSRFISVLTDGRSYEAERDNFMAAEKALAKFLSKRDALIAAAFSADNERKIALLERSIIDIEVQTHKLVGDTPEQLLSLEQDKRDFFAKQAEQRRQASSQQSSPAPNANVINNTQVYFNNGNNAPDMHGRRGYRKKSDTHSNDTARSISPPPSPRSPLPDHEQLWPTLKRQNSLPPQNPTAPTATPRHNPRDAAF